MTDMVESTPLHETEMLEWFQVEKLFEESGCVVFGKPEIRWYQESWGALKRAGLANTTEFKEFELAQTVLRLRAPCLLAMYLGIYQVAEDSELGGYFSEHDSISHYLYLLNVETEHIWDLARREGMLETSCQSYWEDEEVVDEQLEEFAMDFVSDENSAIYRALEEHYGGKMGLFESIWNSRVPLDEIENLQDVVDDTELGDGKPEVWAYVENGMKGWSWS